MSFVNGLVHGVISAITFSSPPLYRYPYRNSLEAFRSDWKHIGSDVEAAQQTFTGAYEEENHE